MLFWLFKNISKIVLIFQYGMIHIVEWFIPQIYPEYLGLKHQSMEILALQRTLYLMNWATKLLIVDWFEAGANLEVVAEMGSARCIKGDLYVCKLQEKFYPK